MLPHCPDPLFFAVLLGDTVNFGQINDDCDDYEYRQYTYGNYSQSHDTMITQYNNIITIK